MSQMLKGMPFIYMSFTSENNKEMKLNTNISLVEKIVKRCLINDGYCPCTPYHDDDHICPCKNARVNGICHCNLYKTYEETDS